MCEDNNCVDPVSSECVIWQGDNIPSLGITKGQSLSVIQVAVANRVIELADEIDVTTVSLCGDFISAMSNKDKTIANLLQVMLDNQCELKDVVDSIPTGENNSIVLDYKCLDTVVDPCNPTTFNLQSILQILINNFCSLKATVTTLSTSVTTTINNTISESVTSMLQTCQDNRIVSNNLPGDQRRLTFRGFIPPFCPIPYVGQLDNFDGSGKGLDNGPMCGWYLCNGNNGTPDLRGRTLVGAVQGSGGGTLSPDVDPALPQNNGANYVKGDVGGKVRVKLTGNESGSKAHTHNLNDPGHTHVIGNNIKKTYFTDNNGGNQIWPLETHSVYREDTPKNFITQNSTTGITISASPGEDAVSHHENRMPYYVTYYIMMIN
jgi:hypothetical protein